MRITFKCRVNAKTTSNMLKNEKKKKKNKEKRSTAYLANFAMRHYLELAECAQEKRK